MFSLKALAWFIVTMLLPPKVFWNNFRNKPNWDTTGNVSISNNKIIVSNESCIISHEHGWAGWRLELVSLMYQAETQCHRDKVTEYCDIYPCQDHSHIYQPDITNPMKIKTNQPTTILIWVSTSWETDLQHTSSTPAYPS